MVEVCAEGVEPTFPLLPLVFGPRREIFEWLWLESIDATVRVDCHVDKPGVTENLQVLGDGGPRDGELVGDLSGRQIRAGEHLDDLHTRAVG